MGEEIDGILIRATMLFELAPESELEFDGAVSGWKVVFCWRLSGPAVNGVKMSVGVHGGLGDITCSVSPNVADADVAAVFDDACRALARAMS